MTHRFFLCCEGFFKVANLNLNVLLRMGL